MSAVVPLTPVKGATSPIRVMVVDDSLVIRGLISRLLRDVPGMEVVASVGDGSKAVDRLKVGDIDVVVLDIEMPVMDGLTALPKLLAIDPLLPIVMASTLTVRNADVSLQALRLGAADYVAKPTSTSEVYSATDFRRDLVEKVTALGKRRLHERGLRIRDTASPVVAVAKQPVKKRATGTLRPKVIAVGSSTGGPKALHAFLAALPKSIGVPIVITQHMPPTFTRLLADHLARDTGWQVVEAKDGDRLLPGQILLAPGDFHMRIVASPEGNVARLDHGDKENFCRPAVDPMLRSLVSLYGGSLVTVMLTGMGQDGLKGSEAVVAAGGTIVAQDEASSVVWGMPGAVANAGLCAKVGTVEELAAACMTLVQGHSLS